MIRKSLGTTKDATLAVYRPSPVPQHHGLPVAIGTGFFVDPSGYFVTAAHVVEGWDVSQAWLMSPPTPARPAGAMAQWPELVQVWETADLALLKCDFKKNADKAWLDGRKGFPSLPIDLDAQEEGTPVYSYGYPLPPPATLSVSPEMVVGFSGTRPRVTSAIIASSLWEQRQVTTADDLVFYAIDKALNYGNSGGPVVIQETGRVFGVCVQFQPVHIPQGNDVTVMVPSLYGKVSSLSNIEADLMAILV